jgi:hypothetical protein
MTIPQTGPRERTVTPAELAAERERIERLNAAARTPTRYPAAAEIEARRMTPTQRARLVNCGSCWAKPSAACTPAGDHLARYQRAERRGLVTRAELVSVVATLDIIAAGAIVAEVTP